MAMLKHLLFMLLISLYVCNTSAMHSLPAHAAQWSEWAEKNKTPIVVAGSIMGVGGAAAYYFKSHTILAASVVSAGAYVVYESVCNDDEFQERLKLLSEQNKQIDEQYKRLGSGLDEWLAKQKKVIECADELCEATQSLNQATSNLMNKINELPDTTFLRDVQTLPQNVKKVKDDIDNNVAMCNNVDKNIEKVQKDARDLRVGLNKLNPLLVRLSEIGKQAGDLLEQHMSESAVSTERMVNQETAEILKIIEKQSPAGDKLSGSY